MPQQVNISRDPGPVSQLSLSRLSTAGVSNYTNTTRQNKQADPIHYVRQITAPTSLTPMISTDESNYGDPSFDDAASISDNTGMSSEGAYPQVSQQYDYSKHPDFIGQYYTRANERGFGDQDDNTPEGYWNYREWNYMSRNADGSCTWKVRPRTADDALVPPTGGLPAYDPATHLNWNPKTTSDARRGSTATYVSNIPPHSMFTEKTTLQQKPIGQAEILEESRKRSCPVYIEDDGSGNGQRSHELAGMRRKM